MAPSGSPSAPLPLSANTVPTSTTPSGVVTLSSRATAGSSTGVTSTPAAPGRPGPPPAVVRDPAAADPHALGSRDVVGARDRRVVDRRDVDVSGRGRAGAAVAVG